MKLHDGLYGYFWSGYENNCNTYLLAGEKLTLIDPGHAHLFPRAEAAMRADGFRVQDIDLVLVTHCHPDHIEAVEYVCRQSGARFALHREEDAFARTTGMELARALGMELPDVAPSFLLQSGTLELGDDDPMALEGLHTPGHSPGSVCFYWPDRKALITGDLVFAQGVGRTDFPGGDPAALAASIDRVACLDVALLLPGHGPAVRGEEAVKTNYEQIRRMFFMPYA